MKKAVLLVLTLAVVLGIMFWVFSQRLVRQEKKEQLVTLQFWGMEDEALMRPIVSAYQAAHPQVKVAYTRQSATNYRTRLQTQLQVGQGPDVFELHASWLPMFAGDLSAAPEAVVTLKDYSGVFYLVAKEMLVAGGKIYAFPREVDGLAMYVNTDIISAVGAGVPTTWQELIDTARKVTVKDGAGQIQTAGAALGTAGNVDFWPEILATLFLQQPDGNLASPANVSGAEVLQFYTNFVTDPRSKTWDVTLPSSTREFLDGKLAFYFGPSRMSRNFGADNPNLHFQVVPLPQLPGRKASYGSFWAFSVSARSAGQNEAWEFVKYLSLAQTLQAGNFSRPYPRQDMAGLQVGDPTLGAYVAQAPYYNGWYLNSEAGDAGVNDEMIKLYAQAVNSVLGGKDALEALQAVQPEIQKVLNKYKQSFSTNQVGK